MTANSCIVYFEISSLSIHILRAWLKTLNFFPLVKYLQVYFYVTTFYHQEYNHPTPSWLQKKPYILMQCYYKSTFTILNLSSLRNTECIIFRSLKFGIFGYQVLGTSSDGTYIYFLKDCHFLIINKSYWQKYLVRTHISFTSKKFYRLQVYMLKQRDSISAGEQKFECMNNNIMHELKHISCINPN